MLSSAQIAMFLLLCAVFLRLLLSIEVQAAAETITDLFEEYWEWRMELSPEYATWIGHRGYDHKLKSYDMADMEASYHRGEQFLREIQRFMRRSDGRKENLLYLRLMKYEIEMYLEGYAFMSFLNLVDSLDTIQLYLFEVLSRYKYILKSEEDYQNLLERYSNLPRQVDQIINVMKNTKREGKTHHAYSMIFVKQQFDAIQVPFNESDFYKPFVDIPTNIVSSYKAQQLKFRAKNEVEQSVLPAFRNLYNFIQNDYMTSLRENIAVTSLPGGDEYYRQCLKYHTSTNLTAEQIHELGKREVLKIQEKMQEITRELGYNMSVKEFSNMIRHNSQHFTKSAEELLEYAENLINRKISSQLYLILKDEHRAPEIIIEAAPPDFGLGAYYLNGVPQLNIPGRYVIDTSAYNSTPTYGLLTLTLHEAEPGHHTQLSFISSQKKLPAFMRYQEYFRRSEVPFKFGTMTTYAEGWALYAETLGLDMNLYDDPYDRYGHYSADSFRASRLVVDTGIHAFNWSKERALQYMLDHTAMTEEELEREVNRYITWPGQACSYKVGQLKIIEMRELAEKELKENFDLRDFHDVILRCPGPLFILEDCVDDYIRTLKHDSITKSSSIIVTPDISLTVLILCSLFYL